MNTLAPRSVALVGASDRPGSLGCIVFENLMNAYARTFDPHSSYFGARNSEEYRIQMSLSYEGIGATLQPNDILTIGRVDFEVTLA